MFDTMNCSAYTKIDFQRLCFSQFCIPVASLQSKHFQRSNSAQVMPNNRDNWPLKSGPG
jgi:hypothetical protein